MHKVISAKVFISKGTEHEINDGGSRLDIRVIYHSTGFEPGEYKFLYIFFQRNTILKSDRNGDSKTVQHAPHSSAFFRHVNKYFTQGTVIVFTGTKEQCLSVDLRLLCKASGFGRQSPSFHDHC